MRKLMMVVAILGIVVVAAGPAMAQATQGFSEKSTKSGSASPAVKTSNSGKNVQLCPTDGQHVNTGNTDNEQGEVQPFSTSDGPSFSGTDLEITPNVTPTCDQKMGQAASAAGAK
jgi:Tfp pilus assembly protein FimT